MISIDESKKIITAVEEELRNGDYPQGHKCVSHQRLATNTAAKKMGIHRDTLLNKLVAAAKHHNLSPDWSLHDSGKADGSPSELKDHITVRRLKDKLNSAESRAAAAERQAIKEDILREAIFKLAAKPLDPKSWKPKKTSTFSDRKEAMVLLISDVHMGEFIDFDQMGGRNSFDKNICAKRLERLFQSVVKMGTTHWSGPPPGVLYVILGGDLISGEIHEELAKSNDLLAIPAVRELATHLISGLGLLLKSFDCEIRVVSVPGNHGRTTKKPESKGFVVNSYDTLVAWLVESWFVGSGEKRITFAAPASGDALINICGWNFLFTHGDRIGSRGGAGMVGPVATIARGMQRLIQDYASDQTVLDYIMIGHFHTPVELEQGFTNGSLSGPSEYSRSGRMRNHPACQWLISVHPDHGVARRWKLVVGSPDEGSVYKGRS
jgi:hypothetical protein